MSEGIYKELEKIKAKALENQQKCTWCDKICKNADHLVIHIWLRHEARTW